MQHTAGNWHIPLWSKGHQKISVGEETKMWTSLDCLCCRRTQLLRSPICMSGCLPHIQENLRTPRYSLQPQVFYLCVSESQCKLIHIQLTSLPAVMGTRTNLNLKYWSTSGWWWAQCVKPDSLPHQSHCAWVSPWLLCDIILLSSP